MTDRTSVSLPGGRDPPGAGTARGTPRCGVLRRIASAPARKPPAIGAGLAIVLAALPALGGETVVGARIEDRRFWTSGWTLATTYETSAGSFLFIYKQANGLARIHPLSDDCVGTGNPCLDAHVFSRTWSAGWKHSLVYEKGGSQYMLLLKETTGDVHVHRIESNGLLSSAKVLDAVWPSGFGTATAYYDGTDEPYLLLVNQRTGTARILAFDRFGRPAFESPIYRSTWTRGWTHARYHHFSERTSYSDHRLVTLYKAGTGTVHVHRVLPGGRLDEDEVEENWGSGWDILEYFYAGERPYLLTVDSEGRSGGDARLWLLNPVDGETGASGPGTELEDEVCADPVKECVRRLELAREDWSTGWTAATHYYINGRTMRLLMKSETDSSTGNVHFDRVLTEPVRAGHELQIYQHRGSPGGNNDDGDARKIVRWQNQLEGLDLVRHDPAMAGVEIDLIWREASDNSCRRSDGDWFVCHDEHSCDVRLETYLRHGVTLTVSAPSRTLILDLKGTPSVDDAAQLECILTSTLERPRATVALAGFTEAVRMLDYFIVRGYEAARFVHSVSQAQEAFDHWSRVPSAGPKRPRVFARWDAWGSGTAPTRAELMSLESAAQSAGRRPGTASARVWYTGIGHGHVDDEARAGAAESSAEQIDRALDAKRAVGAPAEIVSIDDWPQGVFANSR